MSRVGRDWSDGSIKEVKNLTGKIQFINGELQIAVDNYLLSAAWVKSSGRI